MEQQPVTSQPYTSLGVENNSPRSLRTSSKKPPQNPSPCYALAACIRDVVACTAGVAGGYFLPPLVSNILSSGYWVAKSVYNICYNKPEQEPPPSCLRFSVRAIESAVAGVFIGGICQIGNSDTFFQDVMTGWATINAFGGITMLAFSCFVNRHQVGGMNCMKNVDALYNACDN